MSDHKAKDAGENARPQPEAKVLNTPEAQAARLADQKDLTQVEKNRTNASDGSLKRYDSGQTAAQGESMEIVSGDMKASGKSPHTEKDLTQAEQKKATLDKLSKTGTELVERSKNNPVLAPVAELRKYADALPPSDQKDKLVHLSRQQAAELSPEMRERMEKIEQKRQLIAQSGLDQAGMFTTESISTSNAARKVAPEDWHSVTMKIAQLPFDKQMQVIGAGLTAGLEQYNHDKQERTWGAIIGTVEGIGVVATNLAAITDFAADVLAGRKENAAKTGAAFGDAIGQTIVGGVNLFRACQQYSYDVGYSGDYSKPFKDVVAIGQKLDQQWSELSPREQERIKFNFISQMAADGLLGAGGAQAIGKAGKFTEILETISAQSLKAAEKAKPLADAAHKTAHEIASVVHQLMEPEYSYAGIGKIGKFGPAAEEAAKDSYMMERRVYVSKLDSTHRLRPIEAARESAQLQGKHFDEAAWKKLTPKEKADDLIKNRYEMLENPEPRQPIDSTKLDTVYRGDTNLHAPLDKNGIPKAHINADGDLVPADTEGKFNGQKVTVAEHVMASHYPGPKAHSPYISVGTSGVVSKYGEGQGLKIDMQALRQAIASGEVKGVKITEHIDVIKEIQNSKLSAFEKKMALRYIGKDNEFVIEGVVPKRFLQTLGAR